ncbi:MAG TPA: glycosyltransferase family 2 protein [Fimbriimonas sp.]|nr:glycosyltransferase family 2 protein [Fimbriimonas sp.]
MADGKPAVAVIIPAKDEERRILHVLLAACESRFATEIIVVDDGSCDDTALVAAKVPGVKVIKLPHNLGKGGAMAAGVKACTAQVIAFVDADLAGLHGEHIDKIIRPILNSECEMCVGVFRGGKTWSDSAQKIAPYLSGQRALRRELFESIAGIAGMRMGVEVALNEAAKRRRARIVYTSLSGVSNCHKEQKLGFGKGMKERTKMYVEIAQTYVKQKRQNRPLKRSKPKRRPWV